LKGRWILTLGMALIAISGRDVPW